MILLKEFKGEMSDFFIVFILIDVNHEKNNKKYLYQANFVFNHINFKHTNFGHCVTNTAISTSK